MAIMSWILDSISHMLRAPKSWLKYFHWLFSTFFVNFRCFSLIFQPKTRAWNTDFSDFFLFSDEISPKNVLESTKRWSFDQLCWRAIPESWSKYTTHTSGNGIVTVCEMSYIEGWVYLLLPHWWTAAPWPREWPLGRPPWSSWTRRCSTGHRRP